VTPVNLSAEFAKADVSPEFLMVEGAAVTRIGARSPCPAGRQCGYRAVVLRTGTGCEYRGFVCGGSDQAGPCRPRGGRLPAWLAWRRPAPGGNGP
jgi:hypothetical protein